jgi:hypothetical protein
MEIRADMFFNELMDEKNAILFCYEVKIILNKFLCSKIKLVSVLVLIFHKPLLYLPKNYKILEK